jgi:hypothetical protein
MEKRKDAHLAEFKLNDEQQFKLRNLSNKQLALWIVQTCDLPSEQQETITLTLIEKDIVHSGKELVIEAALDILSSHGKSFSPSDVEKKIQELTLKVAQELKDSS